VEGGEVVETMIYYDRLAKKRMTEYRARINRPRHNRWNLSWKQHRARRNC